MSSAVDSNRVNDKFRPIGFLLYVIRFAFKLQNYIEYYVNQWKMFKLVEVVDHTAGY